MRVEIPDEFAQLVRKAMADWAPGCDLVPRRDMVGGRSGAHVLLVDIVPSAGAPRGIPTPVPAGQYVLKLYEERQWDEPELSERQRHQAAVEWSPGFAGQHIPTLLGDESEGDRVALLYDVAGHSLVNVITADMVPAATLSDYGYRLYLSLLEDMNQHYEPAPDMTAGEVVRMLLGYRFGKERAHRLYDFVEKHTSGDPYLVEDGRVLVNPLWMCHSDFLSADTSQVRLLGLLHGDLHQRNLLIDRAQGPEGRFWLIDFALSERGPLFYDHAYFEVGMLLRGLHGVQPERVLGVLAEAESGRSGAGMKVPAPDVGIVECIRYTRGAIDDWQKRAKVGWADAVLAQTLLARVAAGLCWANKHMPEDERYLAFLYSASAARAYLESFAPEQLRVRFTGSMASHATADNRRADAKTVLPEGEWDRAWRRLGGFDRAKAKYVLVAGRPAPSPDLSSLGLLPWSAVIDLDPTSTEDGLNAAVAPTLGSLRSLAASGEIALSADFDRGTAWLMAGGWPSRQEPVPADLRDWARRYPARIRALCEEMRKAVSPKPIRIVVLPGGEAIDGMLQRTLEAMDAELGDLAEFSLLGAKGLEGAAVAVEVVGVSEEEFISGIRALYGATSQADVPEVPGVDGYTAIDVEALRSLEEDLDVLHSRILEGSAATDQEGPDDAFWRGNPPTWSDLHAGVDVIRAVHAKLVRRLGELLEESVNHVVELHHPPGAGGTTAALRAAWEMRRDHPTVILRHVSKNTADRLDRLFRIAKRPVLLVAEASLLSPSARTKLYNELNSRRARVVTLYVARTLQGEPWSLQVSDPMSDGEAADFLAAYSSRTDDSGRLRRLELITKSADQEWVRYRTPFFYGLITYERDYLGVESYVRTHTSGLGVLSSRPLCYLAMVSRYSQVGMSEALFAKLLGAEAGSPLDLTQWLGDAARLVVRSGGDLRLMHPLIAEQVLQELLVDRGGAWQHGLGQLAEDFIRSVVQIAGSDSDEASRLFIALFIEREVWGGASSYDDESGVAGELPPGAVPRRKLFSELIQDIPSPEGQHRVLSELTRLCPYEAHYWNHRGRHQIHVLGGEFGIAEDYLETAVALAEDDPFHHHSLGMVRRMWINSKTENLFREGHPRADEIIASVGPLCQLALEDFHRVRQLKADSSHGYITPVQMILEIAATLRQASDAGDVREMARRDDAVGEWLRQRLPVADDLLSDVQQLRMARIQHQRGSGEPGPYEAKCQEGLAELYGSLEGFIDAWETVLAEGEGRSDIRRLLATAYYAKGNRLWDDLSKTELRRVADLMEANLQTDATNRRDIRYWFQAYRRLPEFNIMRAIARLEAWDSQSDSPEASYYLYILHFLQWRDNREMSQDTILRYMERCKRLSYGTSSWCFEWLAISPGWCPLVDHSELGEWDEVKRFYANATQLQQQDGTIAEIRGRQAGYLRIGRQLRAFFIPYEQWQSTDVYANVTFHLGFSYDGLRAWQLARVPTQMTPRAGDQTPAAAATERSAIAGAPELSASVQGQSSDTMEQAADQAGVTPGCERVGGGSPTETAPRRRGEIRSPSATRSKAPAPVPASWPEAEPEAMSADELKHRAYAIVAGLVDDGTSAPAKVLLGDVAAALQKGLPGRLPVYRRLGYKRLLDMVQEMDDMVVDRDGGQLAVRLMDESDRRRLLGQVGLFALTLIRAASASRPMTVGALSKRLTREFPGPRPLHERLGYGSPEELVAAIDGVEVGGSGGSGVVTAAQPG